MSISAFVFFLQQTRNIVIRYGEKHVLEDLDVRYMSVL